LPELVPAVPVGGPQTLLLDPAHPGDEVDCRVELEAPRAASLAHRSGDPVFMEDTDEGRRLE
jgi:hypothetical protein